MGLNSLAGASASFYNFVASCLYLKKYERLRDKRRKRVRVWKLVIPKRRSRVWRLRAVPKLRFEWASPKTLLTKLRDSYANMMMYMSSPAFFSSRNFSNNLGFQCTDDLLVIRRKLFSPLRFSAPIVAPNATIRTYTNKQHSITHIGK